MEFKIGSKEKNYIFKPKTIEEEVVQNIENIILRNKYDIPLARHKGILVENIDKPIEIAKAEIIANISEEIEREENRFILKEIQFLNSNILDGELSFLIKGDLKDD